MNEPSPSIPPATPRERWAPAERAVAAAFAAAVLALWLVPLPSSLWLDEAVTAWMVQDGFDKTVERGSRFSGGNPAYYMIVWAFTRVFGASEPALRMPSVLAMLGSAWMVFLLGRRLRDRQTGLLAAVVFASAPLIAFEARNARTYAIGLFFILGSWVALDRWLQTGRSRYGVLHAACAAMVFHIHFVLTLALLVNVCHLGLHVLRTRRLPLGGVAVQGILFAIFCAPSIPLLLDVYARKGSLIVMGSPSYRFLWRDLFPDVFGGALIVGLFAVSFWVVPRASRGLAPVSRWDMLLVAVRWFLVPLAVFLISRYTGTKIYIPRYFISGVVGMALVLGLGIRAIGPVSARIVLAGFVVALSIFATFRTSHHDNDWRGISESIRRELALSPDLEILAHTGLVEAKDLSWTEDPEKRAYLNAPFHAYPVGKDVIPLPYSTRPEDRDYMAVVLGRLRAERKGFLVVSRRAAEGFKVFFATGVAEHGYRVSSVRGPYGNLMLFRFDAQDG